MNHRSGPGALFVALGSVVLAGCVTDASSPDATDSEGLGTSKEECTEAPRMLFGTFCQHAVDGSPFPPGLCIQLKFDDKIAQGYFDHPGEISLRPGNYLLTVTDTSPAHNFSLSGPDGLDEDLTTIPEGSPTAPVVKTVKIHLKHGTYSLFCDADSHAADGMTITIHVSGVGQVGD
jgi:hypothetical protein